MTTLYGQGYTIKTNEDGKVFVQTKRRHIEFESQSKLYEKAKMILSNMDWRLQYVPEIVKEQEEDCFLQALRDFIVWYERPPNRLEQIQRNQ